jgi:hypothetical protein
MDARYRKLGDRIRGQTPEVLVKRAIKLVTILDHQANEPALEAWLPG